MSFELAQSVNGICDQFEQSWQCGAPVSIDSLIVDVDDTVRSIVVRELVIMEFERRCQHGEVPRVDEYTSRFPEYAAAIVDVLAESRSAANIEKSPKQRTAAGADLFDQPDGLPSALATDVAEPLQRLRDYEIKSNLGRGGMGTVYKALHTRLEKAVALKVLAPERVRNQLAVERFYQEMRAVGKLNHPNIVQATDAGEHNGHHFLVMELIDGLDLSDILEAIGPLNVADACELTRQAAIGLQHVFEHGLVHRDMKPSNLMLTTTSNASQQSPDENTALVKILDLGLARLQDDAVQGGQLTSSGEVMGTVDYMAPEQATDTRTVDVRADLYSLGCTLFHFLTGKAPYHDQGDGSLYLKFKAHIESPIPSVREQRGDVAEELDQIVARLMAKNPDDRHQTPGELADELAKFTQGSDLITLLNRAGGIRFETQDGKSLPTVTESPVSSAISDTKIETPDERAKQSTDSTTDKENSQVQPSPRATSDVSQSSPHSSQEPQLATTLQRGQIAETPSNVDASPVAGSAARFSRNRKLVTGVALTGVFVFLGIVIFIQTSYGIVRIEWLGEGPTPTFSVDGDEINVNDLNRPMSFRVGPRTLTAIIDGTELKAEREFTVSREGEAVMKVNLVDGKLRIFKGDEEPPQIARTETKPVQRTPVPDGPEGEVKRLDGHTGHLVDVLFEPDGRHVLSAGNDHTIRRWDVVSGEQVQQFDGHTGSVLGLALSPDDTVFASAGEDGTVRVWNLKSEEALKVFRGHTARPRAVAILPDGRHLVSAGKDMVIRMWSLDHNTLLRSFDGHAGDVYSLAVSADGRRLLSCGRDKTVRLWDIETREQIQIFSGHTGPVTDAAFTLDGSQIVSTSHDHSLRLWDINTGQELHRFDGHEKNVPGVAVLPDGRHVITGSMDGTLRIWNLSERRLVETMKANTPGTNGVTVSPDGLFAVSGGGWDNAAGDSGDYALRVWRLPQEVWPRFSNEDIDSIVAESVRALGGSLEVTLDEIPLRKVVTQDGEFPTQKFHVTGIDLNGCQACDDTVVTRIGRLNRLEWLELSDTSVTAEGLSHLIKMSTLRSLKLKGTAVKVPGIDHIGLLTGLEELVLQNSGITDVGLKPLSKLTNLKTLSVNGNRLAGPGLQYISGLSNLQVLDLGVTQVKDASVKHLEQLQELRDLNLDFTGVTDAGMQSVAKLARLESLNLSRTGIGDVGLKHLGELSGLQSLKLDGTRVTDAGMQSLGKLTSLTQLALYGREGVRPDITDDGLEHLKPLAGSMESLNIGTTKITDAGIAHLSGFTKLTYLCLDNTDTSDEALKHLEGIKLKQRILIQIRGTRVTAEGVRSLKPKLPPDSGIQFDENPGVVYLDRKAAEWVLSVGGTVTVLVGRNRVTISPGQELPGDTFHVAFVELRKLKAIDDESFANLQGLRFLEGVRLEQGPREVTGTGLTYLKGLPRFNYLDIGGTNLSDETLDHVIALEKLETLSLTGTLVSDEGLKKVAQLHRLTSLSLAQTPRITGFGMQHLAELEHLETLKLGSAGNGKTIKPLELQEHLPQLKQLTFLDLSWLNVTDDVMKSVGQMTSLEHLNLGETQVADTSLQHLSALRNLKHVFLSRNTRVTEAGLRKLNELLPECDVQIGLTKTSDAPPK